MDKFFLTVMAVLLFQKIYALEFLSPSEIQPGMKGYGLTVFKGWEPEKFDVEIIDVVKNAQPKGDIILAKVSGNILKESGIIAGMSGSPIYIQDKLVGAVAFTWAYSREPICGITPIGQMVKEKQNADSSFEKSTSLEDSQFKKIATPLFISGFTGEAKKFIENNFGNPNESSAFLIMTGGGMGNENGFNTEVLKAGDSISINLVDGDYLAQGIGTVTYVSNEDVFIFGHPMDLAGNTELPISKSYIYSVIPSSYLSFKVGSSSKEIGSAIFDGQNAVYCRLGLESGMVPIHLKVINQEAEYQYNFRVADNRYYFPGFASSAISSSLLNHAGYLDDKRIKMNLFMNLRFQKQDYTVSNRFQYAFNPSYYNIYGMLSDLNQYFSVFFDRSFGSIDIKDINIEIGIEKGIKYYSEDGFSIDKQAYYPGETIHCRALLKEYGGKYSYRNINIKIPSDTKSGQYWVISGNEMAFYSEIVKLFPKYFSINSMDDLIRIANFQEDISLFTVGLVSVRQGLMVKDKKMEKFPENYIPIFNRLSDKANLYYSPDIIKETNAIDGAVFGSMKISVNIINKQSQTLE